MPSAFRPALITASIGVLAACGGGGGGAQAAHPVVSSTATATKPGASKSTTIALQFHIPKKAAIAASSRAGKRNPKWISASTEGALVSITVQPSNADSPVTSTSAFDLVPGAGSCSSASDGSTACSLSVAIPAVGSNAVISVGLYDTPPNATSPYFPSAALLSSGTIGLNGNLAITEGAQNVVPLVLSGLVSSAEAGAATTVPQSGGSASFILQSRDADGNLILPADGTEDPTQNTSTTYRLFVPPSITGVTLSDATNSAVTPGTQITGVKMGDTIVVTASGATHVAGIPIETIQSGGYALDIGQVDVPVATGSTYATSISLPAHARIAGAAYTSLFPPSGTQANGFVAAYGQSIYAYNVAAATSAASQAGGGALFSGAYVSPTTNDLTVTGISPSFYNGTTSVVYATISDSLNGTTLNSIDLQYSSLAGQPQSTIASGYSVREISDVGNVMGVALNSTAGPLLIITFSDATTTPITSANYATLNALPSNWTPTGIVGTINGTAQVTENPTFSIVAGGVLYSTNVLGTITSIPLPGLSGVPVSLAGRGPFVWILTSTGEVVKCVLGSTPACAQYSISLESYTPSTDPHAMALGPDGALWVATETSIERLDPDGTTVTSFGGNYYDQIVASADGRLYATRFGAGEVDAFP